MYYIRKGLGWGALAKLFSAGILVNSMVAATLQSHTVGRAFLSTYGINPYIVTGLMAAVTAIVVIGGVRRIGKFSEALVPLMSAVFILSGLVVFLVNFEQIPETFALIFRHAFAPAPALGGFAGAGVSQAIQIGMSRGMLSNEAGLGTAPMAHATANTEHPFRQGMWGAVEVGVDTLIICTITAFAVLSTGVLSSGETGIELVIGALRFGFPARRRGRALVFRDSYLLPHDANRVLLVFRDGDHEPLRRRHRPLFSLCLSHPGCALRRRLECRPTLGLRQSRGRLLRHPQLDCGARSERPVFRSHA